MRALVDDVLRQHYRTGGSAACLPHLPSDWTPARVNRRAKTIGVSAPSGRVAWTDREDDVVLEHHDNPALIAEKLPGRSMKAIRSRIWLLTQGRSEVTQSDQELLALHRTWQAIDRTIPAANDGPLIGRVA